MRAKELVDVLGPALERLYDYLHDDTDVICPICSEEDMCKDGCEMRDAREGIIEYRNYKDGWTALKPWNPDPGLRNV